MLSKSFIVTAIAGLAFAGPLEQRQTGTTSKEFSLRLGCSDILFAWARGSTEIGNMVWIFNQGNLSMTDK